MPTIKSILKVLTGASPRLFSTVIVSFLLAAILFGKLIYNFHSSAAEEAELKKEELALYASLTGRLGELERLKADGEAKLMEAEKRLMAGKKPDAGVAVLQEAFRVCSVRNGISVSSGRALPALRQGSYLRIPMEFQFRADVMQLKELLSDMQSSPVLMGMKGIKIKSRGASEPGRLDVSMVVESAMKKPLQDGE
jgi:Tfp pilus assembly protein PilO